MLVSFFILVFSLQLQAQETLKPTEVTGEPEDWFGDFQTTRPVDRVMDDVLQTEQRARFDSALNSIPGLQSRLEGSPGIMMRGSSSSARTLVFEDGVPLNFSDGVGFNPLFVATENIEGLRFLKGAASPVLGHDALSGALEFRTKRLEKNTARTGIGSFNTTEAFAGAPMEFENVRGQLTAYENHTDGFRPRSDYELLRSTIGINGKGGLVDWRAFHLIARQIGSTPGSELLPSSQAFNNWGELAFLGVNGKLNPNLSVTSKSSYKILDQHYDNLSTSRSIGFSQTAGFHQKSESFNIDIFDHYSYEQFQASYFNDVKTIGLNELGSSVQIPWDQVWTLHLAGRFAFDINEFAGSAGLTGLVDSWRVFGEVSQGFHPPSISQRYSQSPGFIGNPLLVSEHTSEVDLGFGKSLSSGIDIAFDAFARNSYDLIDNRLVASGTLSPQNVGQARATGFELKGSISKDDDKLTGQIGYLQNRELTTDSPIVFSPQLQASLAVEHRAGPWKFLVQDTQWSSYFDRSPLTGALVELSAWNTLDVFISYVHSFWSMNLAILNSLDQPRQLTLGYPEPRRSLNLRAQIEL